MKAMRVTQYGDPSVLKLEEVERPKPGPGEALVRVHAAGVNYADIYFRNGSRSHTDSLPVHIWELREREW